MGDRYTKVVLTVIAVALVWLCLWGPAPKWGTPAEAQTGTVSVDIVAVGGESTFQMHGPNRIPVDVYGTVEVEGSVECE
jgi:hypothetical protein